MAAQEAQFFDLLVKELAHKVSEVQSTSERSLKAALKGVGNKKIDVACCYTHHRESRSNAYKVLFQQLENFMR
eukprot:snap_masked-scaffold_14-processed-gene-6.44-mRNA-1 protein AED:1.00 eAED:1.00 QI:0/0/0/0/1/1/2/0/72